MTHERIRELVNKALAEEFELEPVKMIPEARIREDLGLDSLDVVDMVIVLESAFDFKIKDKTALAKITTLGDVVNFIAGLAETEAGGNEGQTV
jgi:acyl carrier protein